jgi:hypothetical protein
MGCAASIEKAYVNGVMQNGPPLGGGRPPGASQYIPESGMGVEDKGLAGIDRSTTFPRREKKNSVKLAL